MKKSTSTGDIRRTVVVGTGCFAILGGGLGLLGWAFDVPRLIDWADTGITMKANTALCVFAAGIALLLAEFVTQKWPARMLAILVALVGGMTLLQYFGDWNFGLDTLLFDEPPGSAATSAPGRMGPPASTSLVLIGIAVSLATGSASARRWTPILGIAVVCIAVLSLVGFLYGAGQLYTIPRLTGIALQTASMLAALGIGLVALIGERGLTAALRSDDPGGVLSRRLILPVVLLPVFIGWIRTLGQEAGLYDTAFGTAMRTLCEILGLLGFLWWTARGMSRTHQQLQGSQRRLETVLMSIGDAVIATDAEGRVNFLNPVAMQLTGFTSAEANGQPLARVFNIINEESRKRIESPVDKVMREGGVVGLANHTLLIAQDGREIPIADSAAPIRDDAGRITGIVLVFRDQSATRQAEERYRSIVNQSLAGIAEMDPAGRFMTVNDRFCEITGYAASELLALRMEEITQLEDRPKDRELMEKLAREGTPFELEKRYLRKDGSVVWVHNSVSAIRAPNGQLQAMAVVAIDITDRKQTDEFLRRHRERLVFLTDASQVGVWFCDLPFDQLQWDSRVKEHFWLPPDAHVTLDTFYQRLHPEDRERTRAAIEQSIAGRTRYEIDYRTVADDAKEKWIRAIGHAHYDEQGTPIRFDGVTFDITENKRTEARNRFLVSLDDALRSLADPEQITLTAARVLGEHLGADRCAYADVDEDGDAMNLTGNYIRGPGIHSIVGRLKFSDFGSEALGRMRAGEAYVVDDIDTHHPPVADRAAYRATQIQAVICVPIHKAGRFVGAMAVHMQTPRRWRPEEVELVTAVAARSWESIERGRLQRGLNESGRLFRLMADSAPVLLWQTDAKGVVFVNRHYLEFFGETFDGVKEMGWARFLHPEDHAVYLEAYGRAFRQRSAYEMQCRFRRHDGEYRWLHNRGVPHRAEDGTFVGFFGSSADVSEIIRSEAALRESEAHFRAFVTASSDVVYRMNPDWSEMRHLVGRDFIADTSDPSRGWLEKYIHPEDRPNVVAAFQEAIRTKKPFQLEHRVIRVDGTLGWTFSRAIPLLDANGEIAEWLGAATDVSERRRAEQALRESEERYRSLFESIDEGFCVIEMLFDDQRRPVDYRFLEVNPAFERQARMREVTGKRMLEFVPHIEPHWLENYGRVAVTGEPIRFAAEYKSLGSWFDVYAFRVGNEQSRRVAVIFNNITEQKKAEETVLQSRTALAEANEQLASRAKHLDSLVEKRTAELREIIGELEAFSYTMAHDLREPLRAIQGYATVLQEDHVAQLDAAGKGYVSRMGAAAERMQRLVTDVLTYSRMTRQELPLAAVELQPLIEDIVAQYPALKEASIRITPPLHSVIGHSGALTQVVSNLLTNGVKFVAPGRRPEIDVNATAADGWVTLSVRDNGIGVAPEHQERIFKMFERVHSSQTYQGTGIGLAVVHRAVERMGGNAGVESAEGQGSRFWIKLRRAETGG